MKPPIPTEQQEAETFVAYLELKGYMFHHGNDNMYSTSWGQRMKMKRAGFRKGFPDFIIIVKNKLVFIELKRVKGGVVSDEQRQWLEALIETGAWAKICYGAGDAIELVEGIAKL